MPGFVYLGSELLTSIADAIRAKIGSTNTMTVAEMAAAIDLIVDQNSNSLPLQAVSTSSQIGTITLKEGLIDLPMQYNVSSVTTVYMLSTIEYFFDCLTSSGKVLLYFYNNTWSSILTASSSNYSTKIRTDFSTDYYLFDYAVYGEHSGKLFKIATHEFFGIRLGTSGYSGYTLNVWESSTQIIARSINTTYSVGTLYSVFNKANNAVSTFYKTFINSNISYGRDGNYFIMTDKGLLIDDKVNNKYQIERINLDGTHTVLIDNLPYANGYYNTTYVVNNKLFTGTFDTSSSYKVAYSIDLNTLEKTTFTLDTNYPLNINNSITINSYSNLLILYRLGYCIYVYNSTTNSLTAIAKSSDWYSTSADYEALQVIDVSTSAGNKLLFIMGGGNSRLRTRLFDLDTSTIYPLLTSGSTIRGAINSYFKYRIVGTNVILLNTNYGWFIEKIDLTTNTETSLLTQTDSYSPNGVFLDDNTHILIANNYYNNTYPIKSINYITGATPNTLCSTTTNLTTHMVHYNGEYYFFPDSSQSSRGAYHININNLDTGTASVITGFPSSYYSTWRNRSPQGLWKACLWDVQTTSSGSVYTYYVDLVNGIATSLGIRPDLKKGLGSTSYLINANGEIIKINLQDGIYSVLYRLPNTTTTNIMAYNNGYLILNKYLYYLDATNDGIYLTNNLVNTLNYNATTDKFICNNITYGFNSTTRKLIWEKASI